MYNLPLPLHPPTLRYHCISVRVEPSNPNKRGTFAIDGENVGDSSFEVTCAHNVVKILSGLKANGDDCRNCVSG